MATIKIVNQKLVIDIKSGLSIFNNLLSQDAPVHTICGGKGTCGCCRVKIVGSTYGISPLEEVETAKLTKNLTSKGWRLACQTYALRNLDIYLPTTDELDGICSK